MAYMPTYVEAAPTREEIDARPGLALLEFGANWCGHCQAAQAPITAALQGLAGLRHIRVEDGPGRPLGRSFRVKLWPTLVFLRDGHEVARLVRPQAATEVEQALRQIAAAQ